MKGGKGKSPKTKPAKQGPPPLPPRSYDPLSKCSKLYAIAAVDPWGCSEPPCIPDSINIASYKFGARVKGTFQTGGTVAFCGISPYNMIQNTDPCVWYTQSTFAGTQTAWSGPGVFTNASDSNFTSAQFTQTGSNTRTFRLVGCGLRVRYIGPEQYRSGRMIIYRSSANTGIAAGYFAGNLTVNRDSVTAVVDREWHTVVWRPVLPADLAYADTALPLGTRIGRADASPIQMMFIEGVNSNCAFEYDAIAWFEVTGSELPAITPSHSDITGFSAVEAARGLINQAGSIADTVGDFVSRVYEGLTVMSGFVTPTMPYLMKYAGNLAREALSTSGHGMGQTLGMGRW